MRTIKSFLQLGIICTVLALIGCSSTADPSSAYRNETEQQIFFKGEEALRDKNYAEAIKRFEALDVQYPFGPNTQVAQLHIIYAYYKNSDYASAEAAADRFIRSYPTSPHVDYAYYMRGVSNYFQNLGVFERFFTVDLATRDLTQIKKSYNDFSTLVNNYPDSRYAPAAHQYMIYLRNVLALHQLEVADYYYDKGAYVASANRASLVVQHYQGAPYVPDALVMMAKSYHQLGMTDLENQTIEVIRYNYANTPYFQAVSANNIVGAPEPIYAKKYMLVSAPVVAKVEMQPPVYQAPGPREQLAAVHALPPVNGARGGRETVTLGDVVAKVKESSFFALHKKSAVVKQEQTVEAAPAAEPVVQAKSASVRNSFPYKMNGSR